VVQVRQVKQGGAGNTSTASTMESVRLNFDPRKVIFRLETVFSGLDQPTFVTNAGDGSDRMFVVERAGRIKVFAQPNSNGQLFLDIEDRVDHSGPEQGLLGLAFAPDYKTSGSFYVNYTDNAGDTVIARYRVSDDPNQADRQSEQQLLWVDQPAPNHNGGMLVFGPDGKLWVGMGDGGGANDSFGNGQNPNTLLGKIVRLDVSGDSATNEIWATGLRNPWRFSFDHNTGDLWIADVGQDLFEEINYVPAAAVSTGGLNFGWPIMEGAHCRGDKACDSGGLIQPVFEYGHAGNGCSVTGGNVYRGQAHRALQGVYFYADFCSGHIWAYWRSSDGTTHSERVLPNAAAVASFGEDEAGELYVADFGGYIHRLIMETQ
jgi:glucose/arabinose dehydrogenase